MILTSLNIFIYKVKPKMHHFTWVDQQELLMVEGYYLGETQGKAQGIPA